MNEEFIPKFCSLDLIDKCILRCKMCYKWKELNNYRDLPNLVDWFRFIDSLRILCKEESQELILAGGEAFLYESVFKIVKYAGEKFFKTVIPSSGYLINRNIVSKLAEVKLTGMTLSLDSLNKKCHDFLRGKIGVFDRALKAIDYLSEFRINICISTIVMEKNLNEIIKIANWVKENNKIDAILFLVPMQPNNTPPDRYWHKNKMFNFLWPRNFEKICDVIDTLKIIKQNDEKKGRRSKIINSLNQLDAFKKYFRNPDEFVKQGVCSLTQALHVSSVGDIFLCYNYPSIGNIKYDLIHTVWNSEKTNHIRSLIYRCQKNCHFLLNCFFGE